METNCSRSRPLRQGQTYHFNVIYNHARCPLSTTDDTQLSLAWTRQAVEVLHSHGMVSSYYHDRDRPAGQGLVQEMTRVIKVSQMTLVLLSPGFVRDCWPRYWLLSSFRSLFEHPTSQSIGISYAIGGSSSSSLWTNNWRSSPRVGLTSSATLGSESSDPGRSEVVLVALGLQPEDLPDVLKDADVLFFPRDWQRDPSAWLCLEGAFGLDPLPGEHLEERSELDQTEEHSSRYSSFSTESSVPDRDEIFFSASTMPKSNTASRMCPPRGRNEDAQVSEDSAVYTDEYDETINTNSKEVPNTSGSLGMQKQKDTRKGTADGQGTKESRRSIVEKTETGRATAATGTSSGDVESAVIDRLCNTGLRRESVEEENSITRVYVHGNTVSVDTIRTSTPRRQQPSPRGAENQVTESKRSSESLGKKELFSSTVKETTSDITFSHRGDKETSPGVVRSQDSRLSSENETVSSPSPRRKLQYSEEYGSPSDTSNSISLTTRECERLTSLRRSPRPEGIPQQARKTPRTGNHAEESNRTYVSTVTNVEATVSTPHQRTVPSYCGYSARAEDKSSFPGRDAIDNIANSMVLNQSTSVVTSSVLDQDTENTNPQVSPQTVYAKDIPSRENCSQDYVHVSTENASNTKGENMHHQPRKDAELLGSDFQSTLTETMSRLEVQETATRKEVEEPTTKQKVEETLSQNNFVTSIEDEHQVITHEKDLSESWTTSEYGTLSPRNDLESSANQDSGFLSGGLASFSHQSARTDDLQPKKHDGKDADTSDPELLNKFTKHLQQGEAKCEIRFLKKSSMTETSFGENNSLIRNTTTQIDDTLDGSCGNGFSSSVTLEQSSKLTVNNSSQNSESIASHEKAAAGPEGGMEVDLLARHGAVGRQTTKDDVTGAGGTVSARASRFSEANIRHALTRKDSWLYIDVDKEWSWFRMLLPLYRIMCYALSKPEMPYF